MKVSDYIVEFLISKGITDIFGYPGGMVTHLMDSLSKYENMITAHVNYHEQAAAFAACANAQVKGIPGVAYATSGPGATNLITGIANAYFDSVPTIYITGQVNTYESKGDLPVRQRGFQETDIALLVKSITKYSVRIEVPEEIPYHLERAFYECTEDRCGPVLLDIPMNVLKSDIKICECRHFHQLLFERGKYDIDRIISQINNANKPVLLVGQGVSIAKAQEDLHILVKKLGIPVVTSMISIDCIEGDLAYNFGFIGPYGHRYANFILQNSDLIISLGSRLDCRQTGNDILSFAPNAKLIRIDIDEREFSHKIKTDELQICANVKDVLRELNKGCWATKCFEKWLNVCTDIRTKLISMDESLPNMFVKKIGRVLPRNSIITTDVGQNQVWIAQSLIIKKGYRVLFSGGLGAMGYSLPAAIGAFYACNGKSKIISVNGDGGFQMNMQELQFIVREKLPIKIIIFNNNALGMIRHFQEMYFEGNYVQTKQSGGYAAANFQKIASAFGIAYAMVSIPEEIEGYEDNFLDDMPFILEICLPENTYIYPKLAMGHPIHDQDKLMDRTLFNDLLEMCKNV